MLAFLAFLVPKVYLGVKSMCIKFEKVCSLGCDLARVPILTTPSNLLSGNALQCIAMVLHASLQ